jgi:hypothetical protein
MNSGIAKTPPGTTMEITTTAMSVPRMTSMEPVM